MGDEILRSLSIENVFFRQSFQCTKSNTKTILTQDQARNQLGTPRGGR